MGGYFDGMTYGVFEESNLPDEILLHYYANPRAEMAGLTILGITEKGPDDITKVLSYKLRDSIGVIAFYDLAEEVDPSEVVMTLENKLVRR